MRSLRAHFGHTRLLNHWPTARGVCRLLARNLHANPAKLLNRVPILWRIFSPTIPTHAPHEPPLAPFLIELLAGSPCHHLRNRYTRTECRRTGRCHRTGNHRPMQEIQDRIRMPGIGYSRCQWTYSWGTRSGKARRRIPANSKSAPPTRRLTLRTLMISTR